MIKETWIAKIKEIGCWTEELITFCPFSPISAWSKKLPNFAVKHVDLSWDFGHDVPCMGPRIDVNNEAGLDTRPLSLYWQIEPGVFLAYRVSVSNLQKYRNQFSPHFYCPVLGSGGRRETWYATIRPKKRKVFVCPFLTAPKF